MVVVAAGQEVVPFPSPAINIARCGHVPFKRVEEPHGLTRLPVSLCHTNVSKIEILSGQVSLTLGFLSGQLFLAPRFGLLGRFVIRAVCFLVRAVCLGFAGTLSSVMSRGSPGVSSCTVVRSYPEQPASSIQVPAGKPWSSNSPEALVRA